MLFFFFKNEHLLIYWYIDHYLITPIGMLFLELVNLIIYVHNSTNFQTKLKFKKMKELLNILLQIYISYQVHYDL